MMVPTVPKMIDDFVSMHPVFWQGPTISDAHVVEFGGVVPEFLLGLWRRVGFSGFSDGAFWLVDPLEWAEAATLMLRGIEVRFLEPGALLVPVARSAFGEFWFWSPGYGVCLQVNPATGHHRAFTLEGSAESPDLAVFIRLKNMDVSRIDVFDADDRGVFEPIVRRLGPVGPLECYGFVPSVLFGLPPDAARAQKVSLREHLVLLDMISRGEVSFELNSSAGTDGPSETTVESGAGSGATSGDRRDEQSLVDDAGAGIAAVTEAYLGSSWDVAVGSVVRDVDDDDDHTEIFVNAVVAYRRDGVAEYVQIIRYAKLLPAFQEPLWALVDDLGTRWAGATVTVHRGGDASVNFAPDRDVAQRWIDGRYADVTRAELIETLRPAGW